MASSILTALSPDHIAVLKREACDRADAIAAELLALADDIHANPELGYQEVQTVAKLREFLAKHGVESEAGLANLPTAMRANLGGGAGPRIAIIAEYDSLPGLGHACGHNTICTSAVGAALAVSAVVERTLGSAVLFGTPAEESAVDNAGGKIHMLNAGDFNGIDAAIMVHPNDRDSLSMNGSLAARGIVFEFYGTPAHAAAAPEKGVNALDAVIQTFNAIAALRQQVRSDARIHGIITHGGDAPNIIPKYAAARFRVRATTLAYMNELAERVINCALGAALATGTRLEFHDFAPTYENQIPSTLLAERMRDNFVGLGRPMEIEGGVGGMGSTDFGNISRRIPAMYAWVAIAETGILPHTREFEIAAGSERAHRMIVDSAKAMAMTAIDMLANPSLFDQARSELAARLQGE